MLRNYNNVMTHADATYLFSTAKDKHAGKLLGNNTRLIKRGDDYAVRLHYTNVVTIHPNGTYTLRSGGWQTVTTKRRINQFSPVGIYQKDFVWYMPDGSEFFDGIIVK